MDRPKAGNARSELQIALARRLVERLPDADVVGVLLSGSSTWGDADESSDVDLQILVDRPPPYREVTCERVAELLGGPVPDGPLFVDLDRVSVHGLVLRDRDGFLADVQRRAIEQFARPEAYRVRFEQHRAQAEAERAGAREAAAQGDAPLANLRARLLVTAAAASLLDFADDRVSNHLVDAALKALAHLERPELGAPLLRAMGVDTGAAGVDRALAAWRRFGEVALAWLDDPTIGGRLGVEDQAWVRFNWSDQIVEEMALRRAALTRLGKLPALQYYADGKLTLTVRISFGKLLSLIETGEAARKEIAEFHRSLRELHPELFGEWVAGLRLDQPGPSLAESEVLADELLAIGERELARLL